MKRIFLTMAGLCALAHSFSQTKDSAELRSRKLKIEEVNFISSYYQQDGSHAAVTGGIGSQKLTDFANLIDIRLIRYDKKLRKHSFDAEVGIDHYTSASSDRIDLKANSSASHADTRVYPSLSWSMENEKKGRTIGAGLSSSTEYDYQSYGAFLSFSQKTGNRNGELTARVSTYFDQVGLIRPEELRTGNSGGGDDEEDDDDDFGWDSRNSFAGSLSYSQIINKQFQVAFFADAVWQKGYLGLPFYRVYFNDGTVQSESLPDTRFKLPLGIRANYFAGDKLIIRTYYRYYQDSWGLTAHTASIELPVKISPFFSISPFYRFYKQTGVDYFKPFMQHTAQDPYYTSNYDLSTFTSNFIGAGLRLAPPKGVANMKHVGAIELRYGYYTKNIDMTAHSVTLHLKFK